MNESSSEFDSSSNKSNNELMEISDNEEVNNDNKNNKYIYKNNIYNSSNSNKPKMKNQKAK